MNNIFRMKNLSVLMFFLVTAGLVFAGVIEEKEFDVNKGERLYIKTDVGDVKINSWDDNVVSVKIIGNSNAEKKIEFTLEYTDGVVIVRGEKRGGGFSNWFSNFKLQYEVMVPNAFDLDIHTSGGDVLATKVKGKHELKTSGGDIDVKSLIGKLEAKTSGGNIKVDTHHGDMELRTSGGNIYVNGSLGEVVAKTSGGNVDIESTEGKIDAGTSGGNVKLQYEGKNEGIYLSTSGGDIDIWLPAIFNADVLLKTSGGRVRHPFETRNAERDKKSVFEGLVNGGGPRLQAKTSGGDVTVKLDK